MFSRIFSNILLVLGLVVFQLGFVKGLPGYFSDLNLIIVSLLFVLALSNFKFAFYWAVGAGFLLDIFSFASFGVNLISLTSTLLVVHLLLVGFVTDRSLYAFLMLTLAATLANKIFLNVFTFIFGAVVGQGGAFDWEVGFMKSLIGELAFNLILAAVIYNVVNYLSNKLKPVFLMKQKKL